MRVFLGVLLTLFIHQAAALYGKNSAVELLTAADFKSKVIDSKESVLVEFFASWCGHCKQLAPEYEKAAKALKGIVKVVAVEDQSVMGQYGVQGFPTIKFFAADNKNSPKDYNGGRTAKDLVEFSTSQLQSIARARLSGKGGDKKEKKEKKSGGGKGGEVIVLTDSNFDKEVLADEKSVWFVEFYAPWCGHCKQLAPAWEELAGNLQGKVKIAKVDATVERGLATKFGIQGFPTLKIFPQGKKSVSDAQDYQGPRTVEAMADFALTFVQGASEADQLLNEAQFRETCEKGLCVIAFLPHILDSKASGRNQYLSDFNTVVKGSGKMPVKFLWSQGGDQFDFEQQLNLSFGYPAVIAVNFEKGMYATHRGDFTQTSLRSFLTALMSGRAPVSPLPKTLEKIKKAEAWDGKDGKEPVEEEL
eukprot:GDKI01008484.1.p1 GENE.GDKI01008484.1~~GDKI01008484.1.p1  ORF type:complete len:418 (+),score=183.46 GDKI01008484.1:100-1353(+)